MPKRRSKGSQVLDSSGGAQASRSSRSGDSLGSSGGGRVRRKSTGGSHQMALASSRGGDVDFTEPSLAPRKLAEMFEDPGLGGHVERLQEYGTGKTLTQALGSHVVNGLPGQVASNEYAMMQRVQHWGENRLPDRRKKAFYEFCMDAMEDRVVQILCLAAAVSIIAGAIEGGLGWMDGFAILVAVAVVVIVSAGNDFKKDRKFLQLEAVKENRSIKCVRGGAKITVSIYDLVVGDVVLLSTGDWIPADCVVLDGHMLETDEASFTGEPENIKKNSTTAPFLYAGTKLMSGEGTALVTAVGIYSQWGILQMALRGKLPEDDENSAKLMAAKKEGGANDDDEPEKTGWPHNRRWLIFPKYDDVEQDPTPLQHKLTVLADRIGIVGLVFAIITFVGLLIRWIVVEVVGKQWADEKLLKILEFFITAVTIVVVAVPEGLPLAVTIALAYSSQKMMKDNNQVRHLAACETMGGADQITSDKTGTLTQNRMTVTAGFFANKEFKSLAAMKKTGAMSTEVKKLLAEAVSLNSTAFIVQPPANSGKPAEFIGSKTECALLVLAGELGPYNYDTIRSEAKPRTVHLYPFSSDRKRMGVVVSLGKGKGYRYFCKGASEVVLALCTKMVVSGGKKGGAVVEPMTKAAMDKARAQITKLASQGLRTLCLAYCDFTKKRNWAKDGPPDELGLICQGIAGIKDPVRPEVPGAVAQCKRAGITVRMVTGDNLLTASHIAKECGILSEGGKAMTGPEFRALTDDQIDKLVDGDGPNGQGQLQVIARCAPLDKHRLVFRLRATGHVVASTGDGTNDAPQLKLADVGFAMGIAGTEVAKEACDIILMDDNFASVVKAVMWGRNVFDAVRKFLQFQLTVNCTALVVAFLGAIFLGESPLTAVQLLWVNLIMDTMAALALATEQPTPELLDRKPYSRRESLITMKMWRFILGHSIYQVAMLLALIFVPGKFWFFRNVDVGRGPMGADVYGIYPWCENVYKVCHDIEEVPRQDLTVVFNVFVWMQIFNEFNARELGDRLNCFHNIMANSIFWWVIVVTVAAQALFTEFGGLFFHTTHLDYEMWLGCLALSVITLPWGFLIRLVPVPKKLPACLESIEGTANVAAKVEIDVEDVAALNEEMEEAGLATGGADQQEEPGTAMQPTGKAKGKGKGKGKAKQKRMANSKTPVLEDESESSEDGARDLTSGEDDDEESYEADAPPESASSVTSKPKRARKKSKN